MGQGGLHLWLQKGRRRTKGLVRMNVLPPRAPEPSAGLGLDAASSPLRSGTVCPSLLFPPGPSHPRQDLRLEDSTPHPRKPPTVRAQGRMRGAHEGGGGEGVTTHRKVTS